MRPKRPIEVKQPNILLVEGREDQRFFWAVLDRLGIRDIQVLQYQGTGNLENFLIGIITLNRSKIRRLGVTRDANSDPDGALRAVQASLQAAGLDVPERENDFTTGEPSVGFYIFPGGGTAGMIEDLCLESVKDDPAMPCVDAFMKCLKDLGIAFPHRHLSKAQAHAFLSSRAEPDKTVGEAAQQYYWRFNDGDAFAHVRTFIRSLGGYS